ncbi:hypothetical protein DVH24_019109 [Malus domestica]|uniref:Uncharacterized protein n=1 Tax=Malus domestica TaxID=3750 RepID=A0A498I435_MALDO|nr:hypothetical protein DVH24_019109 [Malus domestica]
MVGASYSSSENQGEPKEFNRIRIKTHEILLEFREIVGKNYEFRPNYTIASRVSLEKSTGKT